MPPPYDYEAIELAFLREIESNPYDTSVRAIFADWLEEHDQPERADVYRSWTLEKHLKAEKFIKEFSNDLTRIFLERYGKYYVGSLTVNDYAPESIINVIASNLEGDHSNWIQFIGYDTPSICYALREELIEAVCVLKNYPFNSKTVKSLWPFSCSC